MDDEVILCDIFSNKWVKNKLQDAIVLSYDECIERMVEMDSA